MEKLNELLLQEKITELEATINKKNIPQEDKQALLTDLEQLKKTLAEHQQKKLKKRDFISYPKNSV